MAIPVDADGIVDDEVEFEKQKAENEAQLEQELSELEIGDYEDIDLDMTFVKNDGKKVDIEKIKRKSILRGEAKLEKIFRIASIFGR